MKLSSSHLELSFLQGNRSDPSQQDHSQLGRSAFADALGSEMYQCGLHVTPVQSKRRRAKQQVTQDPLRVMLTSFRRWQPDKMLEQSLAGTDKRLAWWCTSRVGLLPFKMHQGPKGILGTPPIKCTDPGKEGVTPGTQWDFVLIISTNSDQAHQGVLARGGRGSFPCGPLGS